MLDALDDLLVNKDEEVPDLPDKKFFPQFEYLLTLEKASFCVERFEPL